MHTTDVASCLVGMRHLWEKHSQYLDNNFKFDTSMKYKYSKLGINDVKYVFSKFIVVSKLNSFLYLNSSHNNKIKHNINMLSSIDVCTNNPACSIQCIILMIRIKQIW